MKRIIPTMLLTLAFSAFSASAQNAIFKGTVKSASDSKLSEATVKDRTTGISVKTDATGSFRMTLSPGTHEIRISKSDFESITDIIVLIENETLEREYKLEPEAEDIGEVVIVGYGTSRRKDLTGSVSSLKGKEVIDMPAPSFEAALQGKAAGVQITMGSGVAGSGSLVRVRGVASISASGDRSILLMEFLLAKITFSMAITGVLITIP